jgi:hypothetical protein
VSRPGGVSDMGAGRDLDAVDMLGLMGQMGPGD